MFRYVVGAAIVSACVAAQVPESGSNERPAGTAAVVKTVVSTEMSTLPRGIVRAEAAAGAGLAAAYPGDFGIRENKAVLFTEDFDGADGLKAWSDRKGDVRITESGMHGTRGLAITADLRDGGNNGGHLFKRLPYGEDAVWCRFYVKFKKPHDYVGRLVSLTGDVPAEPVPYRGDGICPDGNARFFTSVEPFGFGGAVPQPGAWRMLSYWCEMEMDRTDNKYWGNGCSSTKPLAAREDAWTCVEMLVRMNTTPNARDGEQAFWIDGKPVAAFEGFRWRTSRSLAVNGVWLNYFMSAVSATRQGSKTPADTSTVEFDDIVVAKSYIGPKIDPAPRAAPEAPSRDEATPEKK